MHIGVDAAMSGVSRFLERPPPWRYSKEEGLQPDDYRRFSHVLTADPAMAGFTELHTERGFAGISPRPPFWRVEPKIHVLKRKNERTSLKPDAGASDFSL